MKLKHATLSLLTAVASHSGVALADKPKKAPAQPDPKPIPPIQTEAQKKKEQAKLKEIFVRADTNKDGKLSLQEFEKAYPSMQQEFFLLRLRRNHPNLPDCLWCGQG